MLFVLSAAVGLLAGLGSCRVVKRQAVTKPVVAHYMVGDIQDAHVRQDIVDAKAFGLDGFAMNYDQFQGWSNRTVDALFKHADELGGFKLFFSFDHAAGYLNGNPNQYADYFKSYSGRSSYFKFKDPKTGVDKPLLSTFGGEKVPDSQWADFKNQVGDVLIVPGFSEAVPSTNFFDSRANLNGVFNWNSWPFDNDGKVTVSTTQDKLFQSAAHNTGRIFMMGMSPAQFKHLYNNDGTSQNWYRRGEDNIEYRIGQVLDLQPDIIQLQSWNDAGEGHYMGNIWTEALYLQQIKDLTNGYDHKGYWQALTPFIQAWKRGDRTTANMVPLNDKRVQGAFWHHTLTVDGTCTNDKLKTSSSVTKLAEDAVSGVVLVPKGKTNLVSVVNVDGKELGKTKLVPGYNNFKYTGMGTGKVQLEVWDESTMIAGGYGSIEVTRQAALCNHQFQVVGFAG
jgi:glucan endo-1,3-alpha-glucosidase